MQSMVPTYMELQWHRNLCYTWHRESIASVCACVCVWEGNALCRPTMGALLLSIAT